MDAAEGYEPSVINHYALPQRFSSRRPRGSNNLPAAAPAATYTFPAAAPAAPNLLAAAPAATNAEKMNFLLHYSEQHTSCSATTQRREDELPSPLLRAAHLLLRYNATPRR